MKVKSVHSEQGFSTLEIVIALAIIIVVMSGTVYANFAEQYWLLASKTHSEALYKAKTLIEQLRAESRVDFQSASTTERTRGEDPNDPADASCIMSSVCYYKQSTVSDISSCSKFAHAYVEWKVGERYPSSTIQLFTNLTNSNEINARGGDCILNEPSGDWHTDTAPQEMGTASYNTRFTTNIDALHGKIFISASSSPQLSIYTAPTVVGAPPTLLGSTNGSDHRLNAIDAVRDPATGRMYAFATQHATNSQLAVFDVTDTSNPELIAERTLSGIDPYGSYPQGWRVVTYGGRAYVTTRETSGPELHIFTIDLPSNPVERISGKEKLGRTVNDMVVREQIIHGVQHRYLFIAASAGMKELSVYDVTADTPSEVVSVDLTGAQDARSLFLTGNTLFLGRAQGVEPELYAFDVLSLIAGDTMPRATAEVGSSVQTIRGTGSTLFLGTSASGHELQIWTTDEQSWISGAGKKSEYTYPKLAPLGLDIDGDQVHLVSQSHTETEYVRTIYHP